MPEFKSDKSIFHYETLGDSSKQPFFWGHGWGHSLEALKPLAQSLEQAGYHTLIDFPGFGQSPQPCEAFSTADYADELAAHIKSLNLPPIIWIGHSFGGRVGLQLASRHPELVDKMFIIAGAGLKAKRPWHKKLYFKLRVYTYKLLKKLIPLGLPKDWLSRKFGSGDFQKTSGVMREIFVKVVNEDQSENAKNIKCPVQLVYGANDTETPPEIGERLSKLIVNANLIILDGQDHYSVLFSGRHPVVGLLSNFIKEKQ